MSMNFDGLRATQVLAELILQFSALSFCSLERGKYNEKKKKIEKQLSSRWAGIA
jgi:hypothetical protein